MLIIVDNINKYSAFVFKIISYTGIKIFVHQDLSNKKFNKKNLHWNIIQFKNEDKKNYLKRFDYPHKKNIKIFCKKFLSRKMLCGKTPFFKDITHIDKKLELCFTSLLNYHNIGTLNIFAEQNSHPNEKIVMIHTKFISFLLKNNGAPEKRATVHLYLPFDLIEKILAFLKRQIYEACKIDLVKIYKNGKKNKIFNAKELKTAIIFHHSISYGKMYIKNQYFSFNKKSKLYLSKLNLFVVGSNKNLIFRKKTVFLIKSSLKLDSTVFHYFLSFLKIINSAKQFRAALVFTYIYTQYRSYLNLVKNLNIKNAIIDYDILFPKPLSLAFETLNIPTIAIQERPPASFYYKIYGTIASSYFFAGTIYQKYAIKNENVFCKRAKNFGMWRVSKFYNKELPNQKRIKFMGKRNPFNSSRKKILFLGYFFDDGPEFPHLNERSNIEFINYIKYTAEVFESCDIIIRFKGYVKNPKKFSLFNKTNVYLCNDFSKSDISYALCKESDLIISCQTSLADECIAIGKSVIFLDNLFTVKNMIRDVYPKEFWFLAVRNREHLIFMANQYLNKKNWALAQTRRLKNLICGNYDFRKKDCLTRAIDQELLALEG